MSKERGLRVRTSAEGKSQRGQMETKGTQEEEQGLYENDSQEAPTNLHHHKNQTLKMRPRNNISASLFRIRE